MVGKHRDCVLWPVPVLALVVLGWCGPVSAQAKAPALNVTGEADRASGLYSVGEKTVFTFTSQDAIDKETDVTYLVLENGAPPGVTGHGAFAPGKKSFTVTYEWKKPGFVLLKIPGALPGGQAAAGCEPEKLQPTLPKPDDFDAFWDAKKKLVDAIPFNAQLTPIAADTDDKIETYAIVLDNINGTHIHGYFSKPKGAGPFPATLFVNGAGVYSINTGGVGWWARHGAIAININAHDIENGKPESYYTALSKGELRNYPWIGRDDRETSYFLRMFCSCYQTARYIASLPEWNGKQFAVQGGSMGGAQAFATAYLCPKVTACLAARPAMCDMAGVTIGRGTGFPSWVGMSSGTPDEKQLQASRYYDAVNFATTVRAKTMISSGFLDTAAPPVSVHVAYNVLPGEKQIFDMPKMPHVDSPESQAAQKQFLMDALGVRLR